MTRVRQLFLTTNANEDAGLSTGSFLRPVHRGRRRQKRPPTGSRSLKGQAAMRSRAGGLVEPEPSEPSEPSERSGPEPHVCVQLHGCRLPWLLLADLREVAGFVAVPCPRWPQRVPQHAAEEDRALHRFSWSRLPARGCGPAHLLCAAGRSPPASERRTVCLRVPPRCLPGLRGG